jgi:hypothetical protein
MLLATIVIGIIVGLYLSEQVVVSIHPNSVIYSLYLYMKNFKNHYTLEIVSRNVVRLNVDGLSGYLPYSRDWVGVKIFLVSGSKKERVFLPKGCVLNFSANDLRVDAIEVETPEGNVYAFAGDDIPVIPDFPAEV